MPWKYKAHMGSCRDGCPPHDRVPVDREGYRLLTKAVPDDADFLPVFIESGVAEDCTDLALSHYTTLGKARRRARRLLDAVNQSMRFPYIGTVGIKATDGECTTPGNSGHFDLHEYATANMIFRVTAVAEVPGA